MASQLFPTDLLGFGVSTDASMRLISGVHEFGAGVSPRIPRQALDVASIRIGLSCPEASPGRAARVAHPGND